MFVLLYYQPNKVIRVWCGRLISAYKMILSLSVKQQLLLVCLFISVIVQSNTVMLFGSGKGSGHKHVWERMSTLCVWFFIIQIIFDIKTTVSNIKRQVSRNKLHGIWTWRGFIFNKESLMLKVIKIITSLSIHLAEVDSIYTCNSINQSLQLFTPTLFKKKLFLEFVSLLSEF